MTIPEGWKLVPVEPTEEMLEVLHSHVKIKVDTWERTADIINDKEWWAEVVASAPVPPQADAQPVATDCGECPYISDGCSGLCEKIELAVPRWHANWHMEQFYQSKHGDYVRAGDYFVAQSELSRLRTENEEMRAKLVERDALLLGALPAVEYESGRGDAVGVKNREIADAIKALATASPATINQQGEE